MKPIVRIIPFLLLGLLGAQAWAQQFPSQGGIRAVTRRTRMSGYGSDAAALMTAGGLNGFATIPANPAAPLPGAGAFAGAAPSIASSAPVPIRPEIRRSLEQLARRGDPVAAAALAELARPASAALP